MTVKEAQRYAEIAHEQVCDRLERYQQPSVEDASAENYLNEGLECISDLVRDTATATHSLSCGAKDRDCNEVEDLRDTHREDSEVLLVERSSSS